MRMKPLYQFASGLSLVAAVVRGDNNQTTSITSPATLTTSTIPIPQDLTYEYTSTLTWTPGLSAAGIYGFQDYLQLDMDIYTHPDTIDAPPYNSTRDACYSSWFDHITHLDEHDEYFETITEEPTLTSAVYGYETIVSFGPNKTYTDCDGIPRLEFTGETTTTKTFVNVTITKDDARTRVERKETIKPGVSPPAAPECDELDKFHCRKLWGMREVNGPAPRPVRKWIMPDELIGHCPSVYTCDPILEEVVLLHFPENVVSRDVCGSDGRGSSITQPWPFHKAPITYTTDAITFQGQNIYLRDIDGSDYIDPDLNDWELGPIPLSNNASSESDLGGKIGYNGYLEPSVMTAPNAGMWTFTSPTVYLAHRSIDRILMLYRPEMVGVLNQGAPSARLHIKTAGIIPISVEDISTAIPIRSILTASGVEYARLVANGSYAPTMSRHMGKTSETFQQIRFGDLEEPIPANIYYDGRSKDCWGKQTHCGIITASAYRPKLRLAPRVWKTLLDGAMCANPLLGDPPIHLERLKPVDEPALLLPSFAGFGEVAILSSSMHNSPEMTGAPGIAEPGFDPSFPQEPWNPRFQRPAPGQVFPWRGPLPTPPPVNQPRPLDQQAYFPPFRFSAGVGADNPQRRVFPAPSSRTGNQNDAGSRTGILGDGRKTDVSRNDEKPSLFTGTAPRTSVSLVSFVCSFLPIAFML